MGNHDILEAPVVGVKFYSVDSERGLLRSHTVRVEWPANQPPRYVSRRGFFFWAFPQSWILFASPAVPPSPSAVRALAIVRVLPHDSGDCIRVDGMLNSWPEYAPRVPRNADVVVARNMIGIARAIEIVELRLYDFLAATDELRDRLAAHYGVPVFRSEFDRRPRLEVSDLYWEFWDSTGELRLWGDYDRVLRCHPRQQRSWNDDGAREFAHRTAEQTILLPFSRDSA
ncbi:MAG: hypothetical protein KatS3mg087_1071 [Patescibacteria group bacterium]|nr:MAG: hypothetical protein KatS3mg087_1071 [Patescibacteria group bacterium]